MQSELTSSVVRRLRSDRRLLISIFLGFCRSVCFVAIIGLVSVEAKAAEPRIGFLAWHECNLEEYVAGDGEFGLMVQALREFGYAPGETLLLDCRSAKESNSGFKTAASELAAAVPEVIVATSQPAGQAAHDVTKTIPIVSIVSGDPVAAGLAQTLARPGGNLTGVSYYATELTAKRLELLQKMIPDLGKVGVLANPDVSYLPFEEDTKRAAVALGIEIVIEHLREPEELPAAFEGFAATNAEAVFVLPDVMLANAADKIAALALDNGLPAMAWGTWFTQLGCLMAYSADYDAFFPRLAAYVDKILKGAAPGELPIEQPTTFILSINMKTATALGIEAPESILLAADLVLE